MVRMEKNISIVCILSNRNLGFFKISAKFSPLAKKKDLQIILDKSEIENSKLYS